MYLHTYLTFLNTDNHIVINKSSQSQATMAKVSTEALHWLRGSLSRNGAGHCA